MKKQIIIQCIFSLLMIQVVYAQRFATPLESISGAAGIELVDGTKYKGRLRSASIGSRGITALSFIDSDGEKHKFKAETIAKLKVKIDGLAKLEIMLENSRTLTRLAMTDFSEVEDREYIYYERVELPKKKGKYVLAQLLNPGFDSKIKVYDNPIGSETGVTSIGGMDISGGDAKTYLVTKVGKEGTALVKKKDYDEHFAWLYEDCAKVADAYTDKDRKFKYFAEHIFAYDQLCE